MKKTAHFVIVIFGLIVLAISCAPWTLAQKKTTQPEELKAIQQEIESLKAGQAAIQKTLDEIKDLLKSKPMLAQPTAAREIVLDMADAPVKGNPDAKVVLVDFSDYQCPYCAQFVRETMPQIETEYIRTGKVRYIFGDFPLESIHPYAFKASAAAVCAGEEGKYWPMHDRLFANRTALTPDDLLKYGDAIGVDKIRLKQCLETGKYDALIRKIMAQGEKAGVRGTPTLVIGTMEPDSKSVRVMKVVVGIQPFAAVKEAIDRVLAAATK